MNVCSALKRPIETVTENSAAVVIREQSERCVARDDEICNMVVENSSAVIISQQSKTCVVRDDAKKSNSGIHIFKDCSFSSCTFHIQH